MVYLPGWAFCHLNETDVSLTREKGGVTPRQAVVGVC